MKTVLYENIYGDMMILNYTSPSYAISTYVKIDRLDVYSKQNYGDEEIRETILQYKLNGFEEVDSSKS